MPAGRTRSGQATRASGSNHRGVTGLLERGPGDAERLPAREGESPTPGGDSPAETDRSPGTDPDAAVARLRARGERVRRRELDAALEKLDARGELTPAERALVARLSARITDALVERWASRLASGEADPETALDLLTEP